MTTLKVSSLVPRRSSSTPGRRPTNYPDLNYQLIADSLKLDPTYIGRIMSGYQRPSLKVAERLAAYMGWTIDQVAGLYKDKMK
jgi:hypothetical protein